VKEPIATRPVDDDALLGSTAVPRMVNDVLRLVKELATVNDESECGSAFDVGIARALSSIWGCSLPVMVTVGAGLGIGVTTAIAASVVLSATRKAGCGWVRAESGTATAMGGLLVSSASRLYEADKETLRVGHSRSELTNSGHKKQHHESRRAEEELLHGASNEAVYIDGCVNANEDPSNAVLTVKFTRSNNSKGEAVK